MKQYAPIQCANPNCKTVFIPTRSDQEFHSPQCQNNFSNSLSPEERKSRASDKTVKKNDLTLANIFQEAWLMGGNGRKISKLIFERRKFRFEFYRSMQEIKNEEPIYWMDYFGIQSNGRTTDSYTIHLRSRQKK